MQEIWKEITVHNFTFLVSSNGFVKDSNGEFIKQYKCHGYNVLPVILGTIRVHRLVATAFLPNPKNKKEVNHINGIKSDNRLINLEWATRGENARHASDTYLVPCILFVNIETGIFYSAKEVSDIFALSRNYIAQKGKRKELGSYVLI